jgi:Secretion system C-terminal sorting domain
MKKITITLKMVFLFVSITTMNAQIINGDFETINQTGLVSNWGKNFAMNVVLDPATGGSIPDLIQYGGCSTSICSPTIVSNSGQYAMEMINFYNITQDKLIVGGAVLFEDATQNTPPGGNYNINHSRVPFDSTILYANQGVSLGFYYKFWPMGNDIAEANLELFDIEGNSVGKASVPISGVNTTFNYIYTPVNFTSSATPISMSMSFTMAQEGSTPTFGSSLIVDDVMLNNVALSNFQLSTDSFKVYPTITNQQLTIQKGAKVTNGNYNFEILNLEGKLMQQVDLNLSNETSTIDVSHLSSGMYLIKTDGFVTKFVKQ